MIDYQNRIKLNLAFFQDPDKTEKATPKKKADARKEGQVAKSQEVGTAFLFLSIFIALEIFAPTILDGMIEVFYLNFRMIENFEDLFTTAAVAEHVFRMFAACLLISAPIMATALIIGIAANLIQVGWKPTAKALKPKFSNLDPIKGAKRLVSMKIIVDLFKNLAKFAVVFVVIYLDLTDRVELIPLLIQMNLLEAFALIGQIVVDMGFKIGIFFIFIAAVDYTYTIFKHNKDLRMSKQEIKDEYKNAEGDPQIKGKIKQKMREASMRRMMSDVPNADVIITNPTHYAVAIKYDKRKSEAPFVLAKGTDHMARRIRELAQENYVEIVENKPLARALYASADIGQDIPPELYQAVAEVLAFVYRLKSKI